MPKTPEIGWTTQSLSDYLSEIRYLREEQGLSVGNVTVSTERGNDRVVWQQLYAMAAADPDFTTRLKTARGFQLMNSAQIIKCVSAGIAYISECFAVEDRILQLISAAATQSEFLEIETLINDSNTWPERVID